jgi:hypothetical protein
VAIANKHGCNVSSSPRAGRALAELEKQAGAGLHIVIRSNCCRRVRATEHRLVGDRVSSSNAPD